MGQVEDQVTPFLKARRAALDPVALGLPDGLARRRVRGLRREEVAQLAGISVDYYTRIEQGRAPAISDAVLDAIARALRLTESEHHYLRNITLPGRRDAAGACAATDRPSVRPQILELLEAMGDTVPAMVYGPGMDILAWNRLANRLAYDYEALPVSELNAATLLFLRADSREIYLDWDEIAADLVSSLRAEVGQFPDHGRPHQVMCQLREASPEFRRLWAEQDVLERGHGVKRILNPEVGELVVTFETFAMPNAPDQRLCTYTAPKGSETERRLRELASRVTAHV